MTVPKVQFFKFKVFFISFLIVLWCLQKKNFIITTYYLISFYYSSVTCTLHIVFEIYAVFYGGCREVGHTLCVNCFCIFRYHVTASGYGEVTSLAMCGHCYGNSIMNPENEDQKFVKKSFCSFLETV